MGKKILFISVIPPAIGGIATWTDCFTNELSARNFKWDLVNTEKGKGLVNELKRTLRIFKSLKYYIRNNNYSLCHLNCSCGKIGILRDYFCIKLLNKYSIPVLLHFHCDVSYKINNLFSFIFFKKCCNLSTKIIVLNNKSKYFIKKNIKKEAEIIPNFIKNEDFKKYKFQVNDALKKIVYVGRLTKNKGVDILINFAEKNTNFELTLVGPNQDNLQSNAKNIFFVGPKNPDLVKSYLMSNDVFVLLSFSEGFSLSLLEAMSVGIPCIASNVGSNFDMLENKGGIILNKATVESLEKALNIMKDRNKRIENSKWNYNKVKNSYLLKTIIERFICIYNKY